MRFLPAIVGLLPLVSAYFYFEPEPFQVVDLKTASRPTIEQAAVQARRVVRREKIGTLSTVFQSGAPDGLEGSPIALMDYYADCSEDGSPALLGFKIAMNFRNVEQGSSISLSIRQHKPMGEFFSPAAHHRLSLIGKLEKLDADSDEAEELKKCYIRRHPDAKWWTPGSKIHDSYWVKFKVEKVYWIGGFGNIQQIGWIPLDLYQNVTLPGPHKPGDSDYPPPHGTPALDHPSDDRDEDDGHDGHHDRRPGFWGPHDGPKAPKGPWSKGKPWRQPQEAVEL